MKIVNRNRISIVNYERYQFEKKSTLAMLKRASRKEKTKWDYGIINLYHIYQNHNFWHSGEN